MRIREYVHKSIGSPTAGIYSSRNTAIQFRREKEACFRPVGTFTSIARCSVTSFLKTVTIPSLNHSNMRNALKRTRMTFRKGRPAPALSVQPFCPQLNQTYSHARQWTYTQACLRTRKRNKTLFLPQREKKIHYQESGTHSHLDTEITAFTHVAFFLINVTTWASRRLQYKDRVPTIVAPF